MQQNPIFDGQRDEGQADRGWGDRLPAGGLTYDAAHRALWEAVLERDPDGLEQALAWLVDGGSEPFLLALAGAAMRAAGGPDRAIRLVRQGIADGDLLPGGRPGAAATDVLDRLTAGRDLFGPFPGLTAMADGRQMQMSALVENLVGHADPAAFRADAESLFAGLRRSGMAATSPGYAAAALAANLLLPPRCLLFGGDGAPGPFLHPFWAQAGPAAPHSSRLHGPADPASPPPLPAGTIELAVLCDGAVADDLALAPAIGAIGHLLKTGGSLVLKLRRDRHDPVAIRDTLEQAGFQLASAEPGPILQRHAGIPAIERDMAAYRLFEAVRQPDPAALAAGGDGLVSPRSIGMVGERIPAANAAAWHPRDLPNLEPRDVRLGLFHLHGLLWEYHADMVWALRADGRPTHFLSYGYATGRIADTWRPAIESIFRNRPFQFERADCRADGFETVLKEHELESLRRNQSYFAPDDAQRAALMGFLEASREEIERELQTPWTVLNVRCYQTHGAFQGGPQKWHADNLPKSICKLLLYLTGEAGPVLGSELIDLKGQRQTISGASGTWLLFDPTAVTHRAPESGDAVRPIVEVLLCPSLKPDLRYRFGGTNYRNPFCPPGIDLFDDPKSVHARSLAMTVYNTARVFSRG
ncbi:MAG: hypothetical protein RIB84_24310 [Sneathiellaceae bacterium]